MGSRTIVISSESIDWHIVRKSAKSIEAPPASCENHPAIKALPEIEREVWLMHCRGMQGKDIAHDLGLRKDVVCRFIAGIRAKFEFLARFREELEKNPRLKEKFLALKTP